MSDQARDRMRKRMDRTSPIARQVGEGAASAAGETAAQDVKPVRITVDLTRAQHRALRMFATEHDTDGSKIMRALLDELMTDEAHAATIAARLAGLTY